MEYIKGRDNLACTIFIPVVCGNNCPFCNTRQMYDGFTLTEDKINKTISWIRKLNNTDFIHEFVISGGEPFADLSVLKRIVSECRKNVFINTSLPVSEDIDDVIDYINTCDIIKGINISRHLLHKHERKVCDTQIFDRIEKPIRINCIVNEDNFSIDTVNSMASEYCNEYRMLNLRADYRTITDVNLKTRDFIVNEMLEHYKFEGANSCLVCNSMFFSKDEKYVICYHRGVEHSAVRTKSKTYINDVIIDINGDIYPDWEMDREEDFIRFIDTL